MFAFALPANNSITNAMAFGQLINMSSNLAAMSYIGLVSDICVILAVMLLKSFLLQPLHCVTDKLAPYLFSMPVIPTGDPINKVMTRTIPESITYIIK